MMLLKTEKLKVSGSGTLFPFLVLVSLVFALNACAPGFESIELNPKQSAEADDIDTSLRDRGENPGDDDNGNNNNDDTLACTSGEAQSQTFNLTVDSVTGANVVFLIDDSGSMSNEFTKIGNNLLNFANSISAQAGNNYRILFVYDPIVMPNANLDTAITTLPEVNRAIAETWSKWADIAFFKAFSSLTFDQILPDPIPLDDPTYKGNLLSGQAITIVDECSPTAYFRPREYPSSWFMANNRNNKACHDAAYPSNANARFVKHNLADYLLPDTVVNIIGISDDDLDVNWDRANFSLDPASGLNAYPEVIDLMYKKVLSDSGLNSNYIYHSIVGLDAAHAGVEEKGESHQALSKRTGGIVADITAADWTDLFDDLQEAVIYSEQRADLTCPAQSIVVYLNNVLLQPEFYTVSADSKRVNLLPAAFAGMDSGTPVTIKVDYLNL